MIHKRTVITFEKLERCYYHFPSSEALMGRCGECGRQVNWLTPNQVVAVTGLTLREIFRRIEATSLHFTELAPGVLHICPNSLGLEQGDR